MKEINDAQIFLQTRGLGLDCCATKLGALVCYCQDERENVVKTAETKATSFCEENGIPIEKRVRRRKRMPGENADDVGLSLQMEVRREQLQIMDTLHEEMDRRSSHMLEVNARFGFLTNMELLMDSNKDDDIGSAIDLLTATYTDISGEELMNEVRRLRRHIKSFETQTGETVETWTALDLIQWVVKWGHETSFFNLLVSLRTFLTMCVSVASCERSFSKLKLIKTYLRSTMGQECLSSLALMSIERGLTASIDFTTVIDNFATLKARKIRL